MNAPNIGDLLLAEGHITEEDLRRACALKQLHPNIRLGALLVGLGCITQATVNETLDKQLVIRRGDLPPIKTTMALARHAVSVLGRRKERV